MMIRKYFSDGSIIIVRRVVKKTRIFYPLRPAFLEFFVLFWPYIMIICVLKRILHKKNVFSLALKNRHWFRKYSSNLPIFKEESLNVFCASNLKWIQHHHRIARLKVPLQCTGETVQHLILQGFIIRLCLLQSQMSIDNKINSENFRSCFGWSFFPLHCIKV